MFVQWIFLCARGIVGDDCHSAFRSNGLAQTIAVISGIGHDKVGGQFLDQSIGLWCIAPLACRKCEADRAAETAHGHVDLGAQTSTGTANGLILSPLFAPAAC